MAVSDNWRGLLADGVLDLDKIAKAYHNHYGYPMADLHMGIADMIVLKRKKSWAKSTPKPRTRAQRNIHVCRTPDHVRKQPICENYVLSVNRDTYPCSCKAICAEAYPIIAELVNAEQNRFIILTLSNCFDLEKCTKEVLEHFGFEPNPERAYHDYTRFSSAARKLIESSLEYFDAPCVKLLEDLKHGGFSGYNECF